MSFIGLVRNAIAVAPAIDHAWLYAPIGLMHGPLYWLSWRLGGKSQLAETFVGGTSWLAISQIIF